MPSVSKKQQRFMGMEYGKAKKGEKTSTGMSVGQLKDFAKGPVKKGGRGKKRSPMHAKGRAHQMSAKHGY